MRRIAISLLVCSGVACGEATVDADLVGLGEEALRSDYYNVIVTDMSEANLEELSEHGRVVTTMFEVNAAVMKLKLAEVAEVEALSFVLSVNPDAERKGSPIDTVAVDDFANGLSTWNLDAINVTDIWFDNRQVAEDGTGVYVAVLDTGLMDSWRQYFPEARIATEYARAYAGGGGERGAVAITPNVWEHDVNGHGTHVTSTILGYSLGGTPINGVAPMATVIPVKVLGQAGSGWSSMVAAGIVYVGQLKAGPLADYPVVINMSLGGPTLDGIEKAAMDYAIAQGVIIVASAGNEGHHGMGYPGAYAPVISVAASGWLGEWYNNSWWYSVDVPEPTSIDEFYIAAFSSREHAGQDLDVAAPGAWVVGPYQLQMGQLSYYYLSGTSMASPHVAGTVALMLQKDPSLTAAEAEAVLEDTAIALPPGCASLITGPTCWDTNATGAGLMDSAAALSAL